MPWTMVVYQDYDGDAISFELTGMPYSGPAPDETYKATVIFQNGESSVPKGDGFEVTWEVLNGPVALVTVSDLVCADCVTYADFSQDSETQNWYSTTWG